MICSAEDVAAGKVIAMNARALFLPQFQKPARSSQSGHDFNKLAAPHSIIWCPLDPTASIYLLMRAGDCCDRFCNLELNGVFSFQVEIPFFLLKKKGNIVFY